MQNLEMLLGQHPFLQGLDQQYINFLLGCAKNVVFRPGEYIFKENGEANQFYFLRHGMVALEIASAETGPITIQTIHSGEILGWSWLVAPYRWRFNARATELVRAIELDAKCVRLKCEQDPKLGYELMKRLAEIFGQRLQATRLQLMDIYGTTRKPKKAG